MLAILLVFGAIVVFLLPVGGGYDEETHLMRVWEMSSLVFLPNEKLGNEMPYPAVYWEMSYRRLFLVRPVSANFWQEYGGLKIGAHDFIYDNAQTRSVYSPPLLLPQAILMRYLGRLYDLPALSVFYLLRLAGLLSYTALAWLALHLIPFGKWPFAILATLPVAVLQAATISADAISNGIALLFIAGALWAAQRPIGWHEFAFLGVFFTLLFFGKLNLVPLAVLPFLILRPAQFKMKYGYFLLIMVVLTLAVVEVAGWNVLAYGRLATAAGRADPLEQVKFILAQPMRFLGILARDIQQNGYDYLRNSLAVYGYNYWPVPTIVYLFSGGAMLAALGTQKPPQLFPWRLRIALFAVFLLAFVTTIASLYVTFTPVGSNFVDGVQGRYFLTVWPLLLLGIFVLPGFPGKHFFTHWTVVLGFGSLAFYTLGMYLVYYVPCGAQYFQPGLCYQPGYKNWSPQSALSEPVTAQWTLKQEILPECDGMTEIRIWLDASQADLNVETNFALFASGETQPVFRAAVSRQKLPQGGWYSLQFPAQWDSAGRLYLLEISGLSDSPGPRIGYSLKPEYPEGNLYENGQPIGTDILFQDGCIAGWEKIRLRGLR
ncbi:MAG: hypothetical protein OHK0031_13160 [Anaerolineales bacterium]